MQGQRWHRLKHQLLDRGWTCSNETLYAPHETMWFAATQGEPDLENLRHRMSLAAAEVSEDAEHSPAHAELHDDLISLVEALDEVLDDAPSVARDDDAHALLN